MMTILDLDLEADLFRPITSSICWMIAASRQEADLKRESDKLFNSQRDPAIM